MMKKNKRDPNLRSHLLLVARDTLVEVSVLEVAVLSAELRPVRLHALVELGLEEAAQATLQCQMLEWTFFF